MEEWVVEAGHIELKYILFPASNVEDCAPPPTDRDAEPHLQNLVLHGATGVIRGRIICSSNWDTEVILLKNFKDMKLNSKDSNLSAVDSIACKAVSWGQWEILNSRASFQILACL